MMNKINGFYVKRTIANILNLLNLNEVFLSYLNKKTNNNYIRIVNYHDIEQSDIVNFKKQLIWYKNCFENVDYFKLSKFLSNEYTFTNKPGVIITFDDGYKGNYQYGYPLLKEHNFTGWFFVSPGFIGKNDYMDIQQLKDLIDNGNVVGSHTYTHHRMNYTDTEDVLKKEIYDSKIDLEKMLNTKIDIFSWCGGEEKHYTKRAADYIKKSGYSFSMMTNSEPVFSDIDKFQLQRTNIDSSWELGLVKFQLSGIIDKIYNRKKNRVNNLTR